MAGKKGEIDADIPLTTLFSTFLGVDPVSDLATSKAEIIVQGVPFDLAASGRAGTRSGPPAVRLASVQVAWEGARWPWDFFILDELKIEDIGDLRFKNGDPSSMVEELEDLTGRILDAGKKVLSIGGDHYIALPLLRAHARKFGKVALIHFDAHTDSYPTENYHHGSMFYHAAKEGLVDPGRSVQVGIRTAYDKEDHPFTVLDARYVNKHGPDAVIERIKEIVGSGPAYISFDIDCLDPAFAPGTGTPVVGGLSTDYALAIMRGLTGVNLIGMDLVEVSPPYDHSEITAIAAATIGLEFLNVLAAGKLGKTEP